MKTLQRVFKAPQDENGLTVMLEREFSDWQLDMRNPPQDRYKKHNNKTKLKTWRGDDVTTEKSQKRKI